jgi:hypothetical protein
MDVSICATRSNSISRELFHILTCTTNSGATSCCTENNTLVSKDSSKVSYGGAFRLMDMTTDLNIVLYLSVGDVNNNQISLTRKIIRKYKLNTDSSYSKRQNNNWYKLIHCRDIKIIDTVLVMNNILPYEAVGMFVYDQKTKGNLQYSKGLFLIDDINDRKYKVSDLNVQSMIKYFRTNTNKLFLISNIQNARNKPTSQCTKILEIRYSVLSDKQQNSNSNLLISYNTFLLLKDYIPGIQFPYHTITLNMTHMDYCNDISNMNNNLLIDNTMYEKQVVVNNENNNPHYDIIDTRFGYVTIPSKYVVIRDAIVLNDEYKNVSYDLNSKLYENKYIILTDHNNVQYHYSNMDEFIVSKMKIINNITITGYHKMIKNSKDIVYDLTSCKIDYFVLNKKALQIIMDLKTHVDKYCSFFTDDTKKLFHKIICSRYESDTKIRYMCDMLDYNREIDNTIDNNPYIRLNTYDEDIARYLFYSYGLKVKHDKTPFYCPTINLKDKKDRYYLYEISDELYNIVEFSGMREIEKAKLIQTISKYLIFIILLVFLNIVLIIKLIIN